MLELGDEELHGVGQPGAGKHLLVDACEDVLGRQVVGEPFAEGAEEVRLLDVLLAVEDRCGGHVHPGYTSGRGDRSPTRSRAVPVAPGCTRASGPVPRHSCADRAALPGLCEFWRTAEPPCCTDRRMRHSFIGHPGTGAHPH